MFRFFSKKNTPSNRPARFTVPLSDPFENPLVETDPAQLRSWAAALPRANLEQLSEVLINSMSRLNRFPGQVKRREELMQIYHEPCARLYLQKPDNKTALSPTIKRQLVMELAYGHLHLVNEILCEPISPKIQRRLLTHIHYAVRFISLEHLFACEAYDCRSNVNLQQLIRLYTLAVEQNLHDEPVNPEDADDTISRQIKVTLLLSLLDPCHLQQGEAGTIYEYLTDIASKALFIPLKRLNDVTGYYVIDSLGEVAPHLYEDASSTSLHSSRFFLFDLNPVSQHLHKDLRMIEKQDNRRPNGLRHLTNMATTSLLRRMLKSWHIRPKRNLERHRTSGQVTLWLGLDPIHSSLVDTADNPAHEEQIDEETSIVLASDEGDKSNAVFQKFDCWRFNQSRNGVALHLPLPQTATPQVGEIVMITAPEEVNQGDRKVGIIRRVMLKDYFLEIGIQFINDRLTPITLQSVDGDATGPSFPALYLGMGDIERSSLIIARNRLEIGHNYRVDEMVPAPNISPVHLLEVTGTFERYRVKRA